MNVVNKNFKFFSNFSVFSLSGVKSGCAALGWMVVKGAQGLGRGKNASVPFLYFFLFYILKLYIHVVI